MGGETGWRVRGSCVIESTHLTVHVLIYAHIYYSSKESMHVYLDVYASVYGGGGAEVNPRCHPHLLFLSD